MRKVKVAAVQMRCTENVNENIANAERLVRKAAADGAQIILLPELFERQYFCQERQYEYYEFAKPVEENDAVKHFAKVAEELKVVLPDSHRKRADPLRGQHAALETLHAGTFRIEPDAGDRGKPRGPGRGRTL